MNDYYLNNLITQSESAYDLVMKLKKLREVHPYEEPGIDIIPLINEEDLIT